MNNSTISAANKRPFLPDGKNDLAIEPVSERVINEVVRELNELHRRATLEAALGMGRIIVERFYRGDLSSWRLHKAKEISFRRLAARAEQDLQVSPTTLYRAVALYELAQRIGIERVVRLTVSHLRVVLGLPNEKQAELVAAAEEQRWPLERLEREATEIRRSLESRIGRPPSLPLLKAFRKLLRTWKAVEELLHADESLKLSTDQAQSLYVAIDDLRIRLARAGRDIVSTAQEKPAASTARRQAGGMPAGHISRPEATKGVGSGSRTRAPVTG